MLLGQTSRGNHQFCCAGGTWATGGGDGVGRHTVAGNRVTALDYWACALPLSPRLHVYAFLNGVQQTQVQQYT